MTFKEIFEVISIFEGHKGDSFAMTNSFDYESEPFQWPLDIKEERNFIHDMSNQGYEYLVFQGVMTVLHIFFAIPTNVFTLIVIGKTKSLWTLSNTIFVINAFFMAMASASNCLFRLSHFPLLFFKEKDRATAYRIGWLLNFVFFRIGNFSLLVLAIIRHAVVCRTSNSWVQKFVRMDPNKTTMAVLLALLMIPSIVWTTIMDLGSSATGVLWCFKPGISTFNSSTVVAFQVIHDRKGEWVSKSVVRAMGVLLLLQVVITVILYAKICYISIRSTMRVALKHDYDDPSKCSQEAEEKRDAEVSLALRGSESNTRNSTFEKPNSIMLAKTNGWITNDIDQTNQADRVNDCCTISLPKNDASEHRTWNDLLDEIENGHERSKKEEKLNKTQHNTTETPQDNRFESPDRSNDDPDAIFTISSEVICSRERVESVPDSQDVTEAIPYQPSETECVKSHPRIHSNASSKRKCPRKKKKLLAIPVAEDYKPNLPISEAQLVHIPLTSAVICVSRKDIICTASLSLQVICLLATHFLSMYTFKISGKEVPLERYLSALKAWEISVLMITMVDPLSCIIFSSSYREAAKMILHKIIHKKKTTR